MSQTKAQLIDPVDGSLVNADINASAAIAGTKISPDFGSQAVATTGALSCFAATISGDNQDSLNFTGTSTNSNRGIAFNSKTALSHSNDSALRINNNAEFDSVNIFAVDNASSAFTLKQGSNEYVTVDTTNSSELITFGNTTTNPKTAILGGNVGIGTSSPSRKLDVVGDAEFIHDNGITIEATSTSANGQLTIIGVNANDQVSAITRIKSISTGSSTAATATAFENRNSSNAMNEHMRITSTGNVGIGTTSPDQKLKIEDSSDLAIHLLKTGAQDTLLKNTGQTELCAATGGADGQRIVFKIGASTGSLSDIARFTPDGLCFGSDTAADNALSDYEVGTFTPNNTIGMPLTNNFTAQYVKVGNLCWITMDVTFNSTPADVSQCGLIQSLPFTSANITGTEQQLPMPFVSENNSSNLDHDLANTVFVIEKNASSVRIFNLAGGHLQTRAFLASRRMRFNFCYRTT